MSFTPTPKSFSSSSSFSAVFVVGWYSQIFRPLPSPVQPSCILATAVGKTAENDDDDEGREGSRA
jgi:hypothetical protein